jgi:geranylgeranyl diphosphate synthase type II
MVHTYSMIHDDLPCMDNDDFRRGRPTLHKTYPEGHAVLAGDFLLTHAFEVLSEAPLLTDSQKNQLIQVLAKSSGGHGMIAGQIMDIESEHQVLELETLNLLHRCKTGALLQASALFGAIVADQDASVCESVRAFGADIGLAFQIVDDILDVTQSQQKHGKTISSDMINHKTTYVSVLGVEKSQKAAEHMLESALKHLDSIPFDMTLLVKLANFIIRL